MVRLRPGSRRYSQKIPWDKSRFLTFRTPPAADRTLPLRRGRRNVKTRKGRFAFRWKMLYICIAGMEKAAPPGLSPLFLPYFWTEKVRFSGFTKSDLVFSKCFVVFSKCRIVFFKCFVVARKQPAECFRRLKMLILRRRCPQFLRGPDSRQAGCPGHHLDPKLLTPNFHFPSPHPHGLIPNFQLLILNFQTHIRMG